MRSKQDFKAFFELDSSANASNENSLERAPFSGPAGPFSAISDLKQRNNTIKHKKSQPLGMNQVQDYMAL